MTELELLRQNSRPHLNDAPAGMYLRLFHGRRKPTAEMTSWGLDGPFIGPLQYYHITYLDYHRVGLPHVPEGIDLQIIENMVYFDGVYYGDWTLYNFPEMEA